MAKKKTEDKSPHQPNWRDTLAPGDIYNWQVRLKLPLLAKPSIRFDIDDPDLQKLPASKRPDSVAEIGGFGKGASPAEAKALDFLQANEAAIFKVALGALARYGQDFRE